LPVLGDGQAELAWVVAGLHCDMVCLPTSNWAQRRPTMLVKTNVLLLHQTTMRYVIIMIGL